ncbi:hypothetical protein SAV31267_026620 [Streptomyces avermitilis]|uniref:Uncharacterized protein n=1 Tax=Streptomyces avermitilis TaxID=33903 RepID=A0A4D4MPT5_STRAX|nr:hypothetical protein SAV31267_026620 [Streptomyces avermitilis]
MAEPVSGPATDGAFGCPPAGRPVGSVASALPPSQQAGRDQRARAGAGDQHRPAMAQTGLDDRGGGRLHGPRHGVPYGTPARPAVPCTVCPARTALSWAM